MPFNGLEVDLPDQFGSCSEDSPCDGLTHIDLPSQMNLKYLEITTEWFRDGCQNFPDPIKAMVHKHANEIQELDIPGVGFLKELLTDQPPNFPVLQEITLSQMSGMDPVVQNTEEYFENPGDGFSQSGKDLYWPHRYSGDYSAGTV